MDYAVLGSIFGGPLFWETTKNRLGIQLKAFGVLKFSANPPARPENRERPLRCAGLSCAILLTGGALLAGLCLSPLRQDTRLGLGNMIDCPPSRLLSGRLLQEELPTKCPCTPYRKFLHSVEALRLMSECIELCVCQAAYVTLRQNPYSVMRTL